MKKTSEIAGETSLIFALLARCENTGRIKSDVRDINELADLPKLARTYFLINLLLVTTVAVDFGIKARADDK